MKTTPSPLLCATDFTPGAAAAALVAARLAVALQRPLRLVHAAAAISADVLAPAQRRLQREALRLREAGAAVEVDPVGGAERGVERRRRGRVAHQAGGEGELRGEGAERRPLQDRELE
ncbi:MAG: hypothetical protein WCQ89_16480, partial [Verrucomicrobiota bacterium]